MTVKVVSAILMKENKVLIVQRNRGEFNGLWEFPKFSTESGISPREVIQKGLKESFQINAIIEDYLALIKYEYRKFDLSMRCYIAYLADSNDQVVTDQNYAWIDIRTETKNIDWMPDSMLVVKRLKYRMNLVV